MVQQGQIFKLESKVADSRPLWAYRYRSGGRGSKRVQRGGFVSEDEVRTALEKLRRLRPLEIAAWRMTIPLATASRRYKP